MTAFLFSLSKSVSVYHFPRRKINIEAATVMLFIVCDERSVEINSDKLTVLSISVYNCKDIMSIQLIDQDI